MSRDESLKRIRDKLRAEFGPEILAALENDDIIEIILNEDGVVWAEGHRSGFNKIAKLSPSCGATIVGTVASSLGSAVTKETPIVSGVLPTDGSRFEGMIPPIVDAPVFAIRKRAMFVYTLDQYVADGIATPEMADLLRTAIRTRKNILVSGGTGTGKTTLANALIAELVKLSPDDRTVIIEDTAEIQCTLANSTTMRTSDHVSMQQLLRSAMRLRPDRIIVGEVRGGEALTLLKSWNTGHPGGIATVHSNNALSALTRLEQLISESLAAPMQPLIGEAVDIIVSIEKCPGGRQITEVLSVNGFQDGCYITQPYGHVPKILSAV